MTAAVNRQRAGRVLLLGLVIAVPLVLWRAAGSPLGPADLYWLDLAAHGRPADQPVEHGAHLALLRSVVAVTPSDVFTAGRAASTFLLTATALALAYSAMRLRPAAPGRAITAAVLVFSAQTYLFATAGSVAPELSAMAWVAVGLAICVYGWLGETSAGRRLVSAALVGALTLLAARSHVGGAVLLWPALLLFRDQGKWWSKRTAGRIGAWLFGAGVAQVVVLLVLAAGATRAPEAVPVPAIDSHPAFGWVEVLWPGPAGTGGGSGGLRVLALLVVGGAIAAAATGRGFERRMLHLMPLLYVAVLLTGRVYPGWTATPAALLPILPTAALLGAELFGYSGLDRLRWRDAATLPYLAPLAALAALVFLVAPYLSGSLAADELLPDLSAAAASDLVHRTAAPVTALVVLIACALALGRPRLRLPALLTVAVLALGPGVAATFELLAERRPAVRAALALRPWAGFAGELEIDASTRVAVSPGLLAAGTLLGPPEALAAIGRLYLDAPALEIGFNRPAQKRAHYLLLTPEEALQRMRTEPTTTTPIGRDPTGRVFLVRSEQRQRGPDRRTTRQMRRDERREQRSKDGKKTPRPD